MKKLVSASIATVALFGMMSTAQADIGQYRKNGCAGCHATGAAGAPKLGDKAAWKARIAKGMSSMNANAIKGMPGTAMMAKGGRANLTDDQVKSIVKYMVGASK